MELRKIRRVARTKNGDNIRLLLETNSKLYFDVSNAKGTHYFQCLRKNEDRYYEEVSTLTKVLYGENTYINVTSR